MIPKQSDGSRRFTDRFIIEGGDYSSSLMGTVDIYHIGIIEILMSSTWQSQVNITQFDSLNETPRAETHAGCCGGWGEKIPRLPDFGDFCRLVRCVALGEKDVPFYLLKLLQR